VKGVLLLVICSTWSIVLNAQVTPIPEAHAHNDYWHIRPLLQSLDNGFMSVEADIHLLKGNLLVNHEEVFTRRGRTLEKLYLKPLFERAKANGFQSVYTNGSSEFVLYIDIKQGCPAICDTLISQLKKYEKMLTTWENGVKHQGAVSIIMGACGKEDYWLNQPKRWFYFDANFDAVGGKLDSNAVPRVSTSLNNFTKWRGIGTMDSLEHQKLHEAIFKAKSEGRKVRFWAASNRPKVWQMLLNEGADVINVDRLKRFRRFMQKRSTQQP